MENIQKMGLSYGLQGGGEGGDVFGEALGFGEHTTSSLEEGCKVGCHMGGVEKTLRGDWTPWSGNFRKSSANSASILFCQGFLLFRSRIPYL
jgi:hypothetical protein